MRGVAGIDEGHEESPSGVVEKDCGGEDEHCKTDEFVEHVYERGIDKERGFGEKERVRAARMGF